MPKPPSRLFFIITQQQPHTISSHVESRWIDKKARRRQFFETCGVTEVLKRFLKGGPDLAVCHSGQKL